MQGLIRNPKDFWSGLLFLILGLAFVWVGQDYQFGTARRMGPAFFPVILAAALCLIGVAVMLRGVMTQGERITGFAAKGLVLIIIACIVFGILVRQGGIAISVAMLVAVSAAASVHFKIRNTVIMMAVLAGFCVIVFVKGLGLPIPIIGPWLGGD